MAKYEEIKSKLDSSLNDNSKPWTKFLQLAEEKTNVPRLYLFGGKFSILNASRQNIFLCIIPGWDVNILYIFQGQRR